jgi:hypothetical protein
LLALLSVAWAVIAPIPAAEASASPDLRMTIAEGPLNQFAQNSAGSPVQLDLLPGNQVNLKSDASVSAFGVTVPVQITGRFGLQITSQSRLEVRFIEANVSGIDLAPEMVAGLFDSQLPAVNQDLNRLVENAATGLGMPLILTGLGTTDTELWLEARTTP